MENAEIRDKVIAVENRMTGLAGRSEEHERRIAQLEKSGGILQQVQLTLSEVSLSTKFFGEKLGDMKMSLEKMNKENQENHAALSERLDHLEGVPGAKWNKASAAAIAAIISTVAGALIGKLLL